MNDRRLEVLKGFDDVSVPPEDAALAEARRKRIIERTASVIRTEGAAREGRGRRARMFSIAAAAAAVVLASVGGVAWRANHPGSTAALPASSVARLASATGAVVVTRDGRGTATSEKTDVPLEPADEVTTAPGARARMVLASGATVEIVEGSRVRVVPSVSKNERVGLSVGEIAVHVPKLAANEAFRVETPNSIVTVHGTAFRVSVRDGASHVSVTEGVVSVTHDGREDVLRAGDEWPAPIPAPTPTSSVTPDVQPVAPKAPPRTHAPKVDPSTLAEQNRLLQGALDARRRGDDAQALAQLGQLLARYPTSPLAQEARVERFRALERMGRHAKAVADARRYLADYPKGFAVDEARALVLR